jgi:hypothetical protein
MKYFIAFITASRHCGLIQSKPFNPILGETSQGSIAGFPYCYEQVAHHPPIYAFQVEYWTILCGHVS